MRTKFLFLLPLSFLIFSTVSGQETEKKKSFFQKADTTVVLGKGRVVVGNRIYRQNSPYVILAYGAGYSFKSSQAEQNMTLSYQYFFDKLGLQVGYHSSSDSKIWWRSNEKLNDLFIAAGTRWESSRMNVAAFAGPSWAYGSYPVWLIPPGDSVAKQYPLRFKNPGLHAEIQATYKIFYDLGVGLSLYGSVNKEYSVVGAQLHLYFSTAFIRNY